MSWLSRTRIGMPRSLPNWRQASVPTLYGRRRFAGVFRSGRRPGKAPLFAQFQLRAGASAATSRGQPRAIGCIALKVLLYSREDGVGEFAPMARLRQLALVL